MLVRLLLRLISLLPALLLLALFTAFLALLHDLFKRPDLREKHVAHRAPHFSIRPDIVRPQIPRNELIARHAQLLKLQQVLHHQLLVRLRIMPEHHVLFRLPHHREAQPVSRHPEVIERARLERNLLQLRHRLIAFRRVKFQFRPLVRPHIDDELRGHFVRASIRVFELQLISLARLQLEIFQRRHRLLRIDRERNLRLVLADELRGFHRLVELKLDAELAALDRAHPARIRNLLLRKMCVIGIPNRRVRAFEPRMLEDRHRKSVRGFPRILDAVTHVRIDLRQPAAEHRIVQIFHEWHPLRRRILRLQNERRLARQILPKSRQHHDARSALDRHIPRRHFHAFL